MHHEMEKSRSPRLNNSPPTKLHPVTFCGKNTNAEPIYLNERVVPD